MIIKNLVIDAEDAEWLKRMRLLLDNSPKDMLAKWWGALNAWGWPNAWLKPPNSEWGSRVMLDELSNRVDQQTRLLFWRNRETWINT